LAISKRRIRYIDATEIVRQKWESKAQNLVDLVMTSCALWLAGEAPSGEMSFS
jgi:hypothetical protein